MRSKRESGEVVIEASIVVTLVMIVITIMMYVGMILYQQTLVSVMANQTAANIAQVYSNNLKDPFTGYVDPDRVYQSVTYSNMKTDAYITVVEQKANIFAQYRLKSSRILTTGSTSVEVQIIPKSNELLKSQIVVTIRDHYDVPLVGLFGTSGLVEFAASGRADCVDILEYINGVDAIAGGGIPDPVLQKSCTVTFVPDSDHPGDIQVVTVLRGHTIMSSNRYTNCVMPAEPEKGDLEFAGWYTADGKPFTSTIQIEENITVYGKWLCEITMKANGGTVNGKEEDTKKVAYGDRTTLSTPVLFGYSFDGWFDSEGNPYISNDTPITQNVTLSARWSCAHPEHITEVTGSVCEGGKYLYKCKWCGADLGESSYTGEHDNTSRCNVKHPLSSHFNGTGTADGCGGNHKVNEWCNTCKLTHGSHVYYYHIVCTRCSKMSGGWWCANEHSRARYRNIAYYHR